MNLVSHLALITVAAVCYVAFGVEGICLGMFLLGYSLGKDVT